MHTGLETDDVTHIMCVLELALIRRQISKQMASNSAKTSKYIV